MFRIKRKRGHVKSLTALLPVCLSAAPLSSAPITGTILLCALIFIAIAYVPAFKHRENFAAFLLVWLCGIPINLRLTVSAIYLLKIEHSPPCAFFLGFLTIFSLFSAEEILLGIFTRLLWRKQYKLSFK